MSDNANITPDFIPDGQEPQSFAAQPVAQSPAFIPDGQEPESFHAQSTAPEFIPDEEFKSDEQLNEEKYGTLGQQAIAGAEAVGQGLVGPLAPMAERALGVKPEDIRGREEANEGTHYLGEMAGLIAPALVTGGGSTVAKFAGMTQAGLLKKIGFEGAETLAGRIGKVAAKAAIDNALIAGSDEASKMVLQDPSQSVETALSHIGLAAGLGGALGAGLGGVSEGWSKLNAGKVGQLLTDFKARIQDHLDNPNPIESVKSELENLYNGIKEVPVYGEKGIKAEAIAKSMPEMSEKISNQVADIGDKLEEASAKLEGDPHQNLLNNQIAKYKQALNTDDPAQIFNATQELKQQLQEWGKYNKNIVPLAERPFRDVAKDLAFNIREGLEDEGTWGGAAKVQKSINSAFSKFKPTLDDLEKTFTTKVADERVFDPGKINTYMNQLGKPNAEIKMQKVSNFLEQAEKYKSAIDDAYRSVGADSPFEPTPLNNVMNTLKEKTPGAKLADAFIAKGLTEAGGKTVGAGVGALLGSVIGHGELGAIIGGHALGPFFSSVLPSIAGAIVKNPVSVEGVKAASDFSVAAAKGLKLVNMGTKAIFKSGMEVLPSAQYPTKEDREKLDKKLEEYAKNPQALMDMRSESHLGKAFPDHEAGINTVVGNAVQYLNSLRIDQQPKSPLDPKPVPSPVQKAQYNNALNIANQPLIVLDKLKNGSLTQQDMTHIQAMYPSLLQSLRSKISNEMIEAVHRGDVIPYQKRIGLSIFLGSPVDSTMSQASIMAAQPQSAQPQPPQAPPKRGGGSKSSPALQKMGDLAKTPGQSREQRQQMRK